MGELRRDCAVVPGKNKSPRDVFFFFFFTVGVPLSREKRDRICQFMSNFNGATCSPNPYKLNECTAADIWIN